MRRFNVQQHIIDQARKLFDTAGLTADGQLVLGLESRRERDLDAFVIDPKTEHYRFIGFERYFAPLVDQLLVFLTQAGHTATRIRYSEGSIKRLAVLADLGRWGKNTLVIHDQFGSRLRFVVLQTDVVGRDQQDPCCVHEGCTDCDRCLCSCPRGILKPFILTDPSRCLARLDLRRPQELRRCEACQVCSSQKP